MKYVDLCVLGDVLREARLHKFPNMSRRKVCEQLNDGTLEYYWDDSNLAKIEKGQIEPTLSKLCELCMVYGIYPTEVLVESTYR